MLKSFFLSRKNVAKCNFKSKAPVHDKCFLSNEIEMFFAVVEDRFS